MKPIQSGRHPEREVHTNSYQFYESEVILFSGNTFFFILVSVQGKYNIQLKMISAIFENKFIRCRI